jgi:LysM repeat protein
MKRRTALFLFTSVALGGSLVLARPASAMPMGDIPTPVRATPPPKAAISPPRVSAPARITVRAGDTLTALGVLVRRSWMQLAGFNHLPDPNLIYPGQVLEVPPVSYAITYHIPAPTVVHASASQSVSAAPAAPSAPSSGGTWACIARGESGTTNDNTGNGYYGYFQISPSTWAAYGGSGLPSDYSYGQQLAVAQRIQAGSGWGQWPNTSRACGV